jgi:Holliday junction DNA helicase RuvA
MKRAIKMEELILIAFVEGKIRLIRKESLVLDVHGIGYEVFVCTPYAYTPGAQIMLYTYHQIREDAHLLFGFEKEKEYELFCSLINVKGIGPKTAMNMLAACPADEMIQAIEENNVTRLKKLPGIGAKSAGQLVLDLKGKLDLGEQVGLFAKQENPNWKEVADALESLGYKPGDISYVKKELEALQMESDVNLMLKKALMLLASKKGGF